MDKIINEANSEIQNLQNRISGSYHTTSLWALTDSSGMSVDEKTLKQRYNELADAYREKTNKHKQVQQMYDALKKRYLVRDAQTAASVSINQTLQSIGAQAKAKAPAYHESPPLDPLQVYNEGIGQHKARSEHSQIENIGIVPPRGRHPSEISDPRGIYSNMPPPPRPDQLSRLRTYDLQLRIRR